MNYYILAPVAAAYSLALISISFILASFIYQKDDYEIKSLKTQIQDLSLLCNKMFIKTDETHFTLTSLYKKANAYDTSMSELHKSMMAEIHAIQVSNIRMVNDKPLNIIHKCKRRSCSKKFLGKEEADA